VAHTPQTLEALGVDHRSRSFETASDGRGSVRFS
jgi:hypothetical protein